MAELQKTTTQTMMTGMRKRSKGESSWRILLLTRTMMMITTKNLKEQAQSVLAKRIKC